LDLIHLLIHNKGLFMKFVSIKVITTVIWMVLIPGGIIMAQNSNNTEKPLEKKVSLNEAHQYFAVSLNNMVWGLLDKPNRTREDDEMMVHAAHASHYHWSVVGQPVNLARGFWLISHVYAVLKQGENATYYANRCMDVTNAEGLVDFDLAYAYEGMARAYAAAEDSTVSGEYLLLAQQAGEKIKNPEDQKLFFSDFNNSPWYGMK
jgi:hypothetical protein